MLGDKEERIRAEAYRRWEEEGRPHGEHDRHWHEAAQTLEGGAASTTTEINGKIPAVKAAKSKVAKPKAPKAVAEAPAAPAETPKRTRARKAPAE